MATHDSAVVDLMQKRVVALAMGKMVRDEVIGAYLPEVPGEVVEDTQVVLELEERGGQYDI